MRPAHLQAPSPLLSAAGLSLGAAVALGFGRFSYALLLPPMRTALGWSYTQAGALNTANGAGYLLGALLAPLLLRRLPAQRAFLAALLVTALGILLTAASGQFGWLLGLRFVVGLGGAVTFTAGGVLAAQVASGTAPQHAGRVLSVFYAGASLGILLSGLGLPPLLAGAGTPWQAGWLALGLASLSALLVSWGVLRRGSNPGGTTAAAPAGGLGAQLRPLLPSLLAYACAGLGYVAYTTFSVTYLRGEGAGSAQVSVFWGALGLAGLLAPLLWGRLLSQVRGGRPMSLLMLVMATGAVIPCLSAGPWAVLLSAACFGSTMLTTVASTTALARQSLPQALWAAGVATYTITFAAFQSLGPLLTGALADHGEGGLRLGLALSAAVLLAGSGLAFTQRRVTPEGLGATSR